MRIASTCALIAVAAGAAHADSTPGDPRDAFGFKHRAAEPPLDCSEGTDFGCATATDPLADAVPYALSTWLPATYLLSLPIADATHDAVASYALGASRDEAGVTFAGANGLENRWTIDGAPADNLKTGGADTRIPLAFLDGIMVTAGGFAARDRTSTGGTIDARLVRGGDHHRLDVRAWAGWTAPGRHTPIVPNTYQLRRGIADTGPGTSASVVASGPLGSLLGGHAWYAAGIAPAIASTRFRFDAASIVDADNDGMTDGVPGLTTTSAIETTKPTPITWSVPVMLRTGLDRGHHHVELTLIGGASTATRFLSNATLQAGGIDSTNMIGDGIATWRGVWPKVRARVQLAWHRSTHREAARDAAGSSIPQLLSAYVPATLADDPVLAARCIDGGANDPYPMVANCPIPIGWFASGGAGPLVDTTADRPSITADLAHTFGANVIRIGATGEDSRLVTDSHFTGGAQHLSLFDGHLTTRRFVDPAQACSEDVTKACPFVDTSSLAYRTRYTAAYLEDTWQASPEIVVDGGMRWELMWVGPAMHFSNELAPRLGTSWDPLGHGRSRVWTSMGRSFALLPAGLGATILRRDRTADDTSFNGSTTRSVDTGLPLTVTPGVEPLAQDELTAGAEVALTRAVRVTTWLQGRWLRRGLESTPDGFDNPGHLGGMPAIRETTVFAAEIATTPAAKLVVRAGYMYGHTTGSWTGAFDPREGAVLYNGSDFDTATLNQLGALPTDVGHRVYIEGARKGRIGQIDVGVSTRLTVASGRPRDALGDGADGLMYLIPRGAAGRGPMQSQANVQLLATWHRVDFTLDLFDVFDRRDATNLDAVYAAGAVHPIEGGTLDDLVFLKTDAGVPAVRRTSYDVGTAYQAPFAAVLGIHTVL